VRALAEEIQDGAGNGMAVRVTVEAAPLDAAGDVDVGEVVEGKSVQHRHRVPWLRALA
jgi:uncharacterized protein (DUF342 family)